MPEKPVTSGLDKCVKCSTSRADDQAGYEPSPTTHTDICCLFRLAHQGQSNSFLYEQSLKLRDCGRCKDCPALKAHKQELVDLAHDPPRSSSDPPQEGVTPVGAELGSPTKKRKKIEPRLRTGFKKLTLEIRPERFKKKLWFGTYSADEIDRARDAVNFYMGCNQQYKYPDSPVIFASKPLKGIKFTDLHPSCDDEVEVDGVPELKYKYFARQVKDVIHAVVGKQKKANSQKRNKSKEPADETPIGDPTVPGTSSSETLTWDPLGIQCSSPETLTYEETLQIAALLRSHNGREDTFTLEEMFAFSPPDHEGDDFPQELLWAFQNDVLP